MWYNVEWYNILYTKTTVVSLIMKVLVLPLGRMSTNCLIVYDEATHIGAVVDPGGEDSSERIVNRCLADGIEIKYILLTHAHFDHMLSLEALREMTGAPLALHCHDAESLTDPNLTYMAQFAGISTGCNPAEILLSDGDVIELGETKLTVMHTPGHTMGSVCYMTDGIILTGDTLFSGSIGRCDLYGGDDMTMEDSLKRLVRLPGDYKLYPGHGSTTTLSRERANNVYLKHFV